MNSRTHTSAQPAEHGLASRAAYLLTVTVEQVFATVARIHDITIDLHRSARAQDAQMCDSDVRAIRDRVLGLLAGDGELAVGMGLIMAPGLIAGPRLRMEWWQQDSVRDVPAWLDVDLNPSSVDFYDYPSAEWFSVPRDTGARHIVGPYVDVHGTGRYVLTLTMPVVDDEFLGVAGADVPVARLERHLLSQLGATTADVVVVNDERRVVLSSSPAWLTGALVDIAGGSAAGFSSAVDIAGTPWQLYLARS
jgi:hypothetical protein